MRPPSKGRGAEVKPGHEHDSDSSSMSDEDNNGGAENGSIWMSPPPSWPLIQSSNRQVGVLLAAAYT